MRIRLSSLVALVALAACGGGSAPPPPVARASASPAVADLQPLSSRDSGGPPAAPGAEASLPPGHPPIGSANPHAGADPHGNVASIGPARSAGSVTGTIEVAPKLQRAAGGVLYVIAKRGSATVAARRVDKPSFPFAFEISGTDAMTPGSGFEGPLDVIARVSKSGDAIPAKGDIEGVAHDVPVPAKGVVITIDAVRR